MDNNNTKGIVAGRIVCYASLISWDPAYIETTMVEYANGLCCGVTVSQPHS